MGKAGKGTILIVDDEADLREAIGTDFRKDGYNILEAENGLDGFKMCLEQSVSLVLADFRMPQCDGLTLLNMIKKDNPLLPVILFITTSAEVSVEEAYNQGAEALFMKPFDRRALKAAVRDALAPGADYIKRRKCPRHEIALPINLEIPGAGSEKNHKLLNIGRGGMFVGVTAGVPPAVGQKITFSFSVSESRPVHVHGTGIVRWVRTKSDDMKPAGFGLEFQGFEGNSRAAFMELINAIRTMAYNPNR